MPAVFLSFLPRPLANAESRLPIVSGAIPLRPCFRLFLPWQSDLSKTALAQQSGLYRSNRFPLSAASARLSGQYSATFSRGVPSPIRKLISSLDEFTASAPVWQKSGYVYSILSASLD